ncbi:hypothetical protein MKW94_005522 [Papaver nudicaule]|uniref:Uncharacterized protein n=1 Tax=Papaver nudicaule TaxID=74823 RepID=A0AA42AXY7_PAPNU|nr:hypothetical protein [Papaver nudicaule]MCL7043875.1 hypothetical protein [Papaver nudicaule]
MEKVSLTRKAVYALRSLTFKQRLVTITDEILAVNDKFSKVKADPYIEHILFNSPKMNKHVHEVIQRFDNSAEPLFERCRRYQEHEQPNHYACKMFRDYVSPSVATALIGALLGAIAYKRHLNKKDQGNEIHLPFSLLQNLKRNCQLKLPNKLVQG